MLKLFLSLIVSVIAVLLIGPRVLPVLRKLKFGPIRKICLFRRSWFACRMCWAARLHRPERFLDSAAWKCRLKAPDLRFGRSQPRGSIVRVKPS